jgi:hypothetical protein
MWWVAAQIFGWFLAALVLFTLLAPFELELKISRTGEDDRIEATIWLWFHLLPLRKTWDTAELNLFSQKIHLHDAGARREMPVRPPEPGSPVQDGTNTEREWDAVGLEEMRWWWRWFRLLQARIHRFKPFLLRFLKSVKVKRFRWETTIGTGDAASTGWAAGMLWMLKGTVGGTLCHFFTATEKPEIAVKPDFQRFLLRTEAHCIFQIGVGQAILAGIKLVTLWFKEGMIWRTIRSKA